MGQAQTQLDSPDLLPESIDEATALNLLGKCFDRADWEIMSGGTGSVDKGTFLTQIELRNHAPSLRAWLEHWRLDELTQMLMDEDVMFPTDLPDLEPKVIESLQLKTIQKKHWAKAMAHALYMQRLGIEKPPSPLQVWMESWRLGRLYKGMMELGCDVKEDLIDLDEADLAPLQMRLLEQRRWKQGKEQLMNMIRAFDFNDDSRSSVPSLQAWLRSLLLDDNLTEKLEAMGAFELADLADIDDRELASLGMSKLQLKHWNMGLKQVLAAKAEAMADGKNDDPTLRAWAESWRLGRLMTTFDEIGVVQQQDLLDLEPSEYTLLKMKPLEAKRFEQAMIALEDEFLTPPPGAEDFAGSGNYKSINVKPRG